MAIYGIMTNFENDGNMNSSDKCQWYKNIINDFISADEECLDMMLVFTMKKICLIFIGAGVTEKEIEECEINYFYNSPVNNDSGNKFINLLILVILILLIYWINK